MPNKPHSYGTTIYRGASTTKVNQVKSIEIDGIEVSSVDVTDLESSNQAREFVRGLMDGGEVTLEVYADDDEIETLYALMGTSETWVIKFPLQSGETTEAQWSFTGFPTSFGNSYQEDEAIVVPMTVKISGKPTFTKAS